jgi:hypothetical protein
MVYIKIKDKMRIKNTAMNQIKEFFRISLVSVLLLQHVASSLLVIRNLCQENKRDLFGIIILFYTYTINRFRTGTNWVFFLNG